MSTGPAKPGPSIWRYSPNGGSGAVRQGRYLGYPPPPPPREAALPRAVSRLGELARPVVDVAFALRDQLVLVVAGPDADLVAVGVDGHRRVALRGEHQQADGHLAAVRQLVRAFRALGEADDLAGLQGLVAARPANRQRAVENDEPLLVAVLVVVRAIALASPELVDRAAEHRSADRLAEAEVTGDVAVGVALVVGELGREEVDPLRRHIALPSSNRHRCGSRSVPRIRAGRSPRPRSRGATWRSSRSTSTESPAAAATHARASTARRRPRRRSARSRPPARGAARSR